MQGYLYLARQLIAKRRIRFVFLMISIVIGVASLFVLLSLRLGVEQFLSSKAVASIGVNQIIVRPKFHTSFLIVNKEVNKELTNTSIDDLKKIPQVDTVYSNVVLKVPTSIQIPLPSNTLESDAPVFGAELEFVKEDLKNPSEFNANAAELPVVISRDLVDFFNAGFADSLGIKNINEEILIGRTFTLFVGYSSFLGYKGPDVMQINAKIIGLSNKVPVVGITVPIEKVEEWSKKFDKGESKVNSLVVMVKSPADVERVSQQIEDMGFAADSLQKRINGVSENLKVLTLILSLISLVILISVAISIFNTFFSDVFENISTIGILRSVGATKGFIASLILSKSMIVSFWGGLIGVIIGAVMSYYANVLLLKDLPFFSSQQVSMVAMPWYLFVGMLVFSLLLGIVASLYPAWYGSRLDPAQALRR